MSQALPVEDVLHLGVLRSILEASRAVWRNASARTRAFIQTGLLIVSVIVAFNYSLSTLLQNAGQETPLAYVSLVPLIALGLAALRARPLRPEPLIHDRQVDYIVGVPLIAGALAANLLLPTKLSVMYWVWRIDLLTLPVFVAGAVAIIFGVRVLWRQKLAVGFLFLGWPYPYTTVLLSVLNLFTSVTLRVTEAVVKVLPVAKAVISPTTTIFVINHHGTIFPVSVVSACSGVNSVVGFLLIGSAFGAVVRGPIIRKSLWLVGGMAMLWALNIGRIIFIFWAGRTWGEHVAIGILHPFIGLVIFAVGVVLLMLLIRPLGMRIASAPRPRMESATVQGAGVARVSRSALAVPRVFLAGLLVSLAAVVIAHSNLALQSFNLVADASGAPKLEAYIAAPAAATGWNVAKLATFDWAKPLFGDTSVWNRYILHWAGTGDLGVGVPVIADVIETPNRSTFSAFGVEACYQFHGYSLRDIAQVSLAGGISGQAMSYTSPVFGSWSIVYWIIPVKLNGATSYQRTVLYVQNTNRGVVVPATHHLTGISNLVGTLGAGDTKLIQNRAFLVAFAREIIRNESSGKVRRWANLIATTSNSSAASTNPAGSVTSTSTALTTTTLPPAASASVTLHR